MLVLEPMKPSKGDVRRWLVRVMARRNGAGWEATGDVLVAWTGGLWVAVLREASGPPATWAACWLDADPSWSVTNIRNEITTIRHASSEAALSRPALRP